MLIKYNIYLTIDNTYSIFVLRPKNTIVNETYDEQFFNKVEEESAEIGNASAENLKKKQEYEKIGQVEKSEYQKMIEITSDTQSNER